VISFKVNGQDKSVEVEPEMPLLWVLREELGLTGTKFGCGQVACGACTVLIEGKPTKTCTRKVSTAAGKSITTIEGLVKDGKLHPVQRAWMEEIAPQCGYCQSGQILAAYALLKSNPSPSDDEIVEAMNENICRCGTYNEIRAAIRRAAELMQGETP
jgi:isoquinoline 1-oxidoreductase alpha subunit